MPARSRTRAAADPVPRSLADDLRARDDEALAALLRHRPDLVHPVPPDLTALVSRASTSVSVSRALDRLDRWALQVAEVLAALPDPCTRADLLAALPEVEPGAVDSAVAALRERALLWGRDELHLVRAARELGPWPCGLYPPGLSDLPAEELSAMLADAPEEVLGVLQALLWGPPTGSVANADRPVNERTARTPVEWLLARGLLIPLNAGTVALPREVALPLRGGAFLESPEPLSPTEALGRLAAPGPDTAAAAGQSAFTAVRLVEDLLEHWSVAPPAQLRNGGLGVRDLAATARLLDVAEPTAALLAEVALAAGLLASDEEERPLWLPTPAYDAWLALTTEGRWALLAEAWLAMPRVPATASEERANVLGPALERPDAPEVRRLVLDVVRDLGAAAVPDRVRAEIDWRRPRRASAVRALMIDAAIEEAEVLGVTGLGALAPGGAALLEAAPVEAARGRRTAAPSSPVAGAVAPWLPAPVDHVLLQADLTVVAPGPLESGLAREVALLADVESTGGATVYRISAASLRRAFDAGRSASDVMALLESRSRTPVPQPLAYLVEDVARRHGAVRVGAAGSYVRCDDDATLAAVLADKRAARLRPMRLAPGVLALQAPVDEALAVLRELGLAPAAEAPDGTVVVRRPDSQRAAGRPRAAHRPAELREPDPLLLTAAVRALRAGDRISGGARPEGAPERLGVIPVSAPSDTIAAVREAIDDGRSLWIGYADTDGRATERVIDPIEVSRGFLTAYDHRYEEVRSFALARITGVAAYADGE